MTFMPKIMAYGASDASLLSVHFTVGAKPYSHMRFTDLPKKASAYSWTSDERQKVLMGLVYFQAPYTAGSRYGHEFIHKHHSRITRADRLRWPNLSLSRPDEGSRPGREGGRDFTDGTGRKKPQ
jgi:hypothetical protein